MSGVGILVVVGAAGLVALLTWFFFCPKTVRSAALLGGMHVEADASTPPATYDHKTYWFCSAHCHDAFTADPQRYQPHPVTH